MKKLLVLALVLMSANAFAQTSTGPSGLGIYFETGALTNSKAYSEGTQVTAYVCATHIITPQLGAYEFSVVFDGDVLLDDVQWTYSNGTAAVNALAPPDFIVACGPVIPAANSNYLVRIRFIMGTTPVLMGVGPTVPASIPGKCCYANGDFTQLIPFTLSSSAMPVAGRPGFYYLACAGGTGPVATASDSWSGVKSLYR